MSCPTCQDECNWNVLMPCKVCSLNNGDSTPKIVCHCKLCGAYICKPHWADWVARGLAAWNNLFAPKEEVVPNAMPKYENPPSPPTKEQTKNAEGKKEEEDFGGEASSSQPVKVQEDPKKERGFFKGKKNK